MFINLESARMFDSCRLNVILDFIGYLRHCANNLLSWNFSFLVCNGGVGVTSGLQGGKDPRRFCLQRSQCCASCVVTCDKRWLSGVGQLFSPVPFLTLGEQAVTFDVCKTAYHGSPLAETKLRAA